MLKHLNIRLRHLTSSLLIFIVIMLFTSTLYESYRWNNINSVNTANLNRFVYAADSFSQMIKTLDDLVSLSGMDRIVSLDTTESAAIGTEAQIFSLLSNLNAKIAEDVQVLFFKRGSSNIYTEDECMQYSAFEKMMKTQYDLAMSQFYLHLCTDSDYSLFPIMTNAQTTGAVARIIPLSSDDKNVSCFLAFILPEQWIREELERYMSDLHGDLYVVDQRYKMVFSSLNKEEPHISLKDLLKRKGSGLQEYDSENIMLSVSKMDAGLHFILCESKSEFYASIIPALQQFKLKLVLLGLVLLLLFGWQILFNYMPIRRLASEISGPQAIRNVPDELAMIRASYNHTVEEVEKLSGQVSELASLATRHFLNRWVLGQIPDRAAFDKLSSYADLDLSRRFFIAMFFAIDASVSDVGERDRFMHLLDHLRCADKTFLAGELSIENALFLIANYNAAEDGSREAIETGNQVLDFIKSNGFASVHIGVGTPCTDPLKLPESYREASAAAKIARSQNTELCFYKTQNEAAPSDALTYGFPPMSVSLLIASINRADPVMAKRALTEIMDHILRVTDSMIYFRFYSSNLVKLLLDEAEQNHIQYSQAEIHFLITVNSAKEFEENIQAFVEKLCAQVQARNALGDTRMKDRLMAYILDHYKDYGMSVQSVSEATGVPSSDISRIIKEELGVNFVQYVSYLRMNEFKRLLIETDRTISELVLEIGYSDVSNFLRKFKSIEGITAGQYRDKYAAPRSNP